MTDFPEKEAVLEAINEIRAELGLPPATEIRPGCRGNPMHCPLASTIAAGSRMTVLVGTRNWHQGWASREGPLPSVLKQFVRDVDRGKYPELVTYPAR